MTTNPPDLTSLCVADDATFWPWRRWPEFSRWPDPAGTIVIVPLAGTADWGLGHALDAEETVLLHVLHAAVRQRPASLPVLVVPPLRFVLGPAPGCAFPVTAPVAHDLVREILGSIAASGFRRVLLYNSSPWNEEFIAAAARDNRIEYGLQIFRISLSGLGLDLHPTRSASRRKFQTLVTALTGRAPEAPAAGRGAPPVRPWGDESVFPLLDPPVPLTEARSEGAATLAGAAAHLVSLLQEIGARPPLARGGAIARAIFPPAP